MEIYVYSVKYYDDYKGKTVSASGVVCGKSISDAVETLENFFDDIEEVKVFVLEGSNGGVIYLSDINSCVINNNLICE